MTYAVSRAMFNEYLTTSQMDQDSQTCMGY